MKSFAWGIIIGASFAAGCSGAKDAGSASATITPAETNRLLGHDTSYIFLDVRTPAEYQSPTGHLEGALLIPVDSLEQRVGELQQYRDKTVITYCRSGVRSARAQKILIQQGFRALSMTGGITRWNNEQLPVVKEQQ